MAPEVEPHSSRRPGISLMGVLALVAVIVGLGVFLALRSNTRRDLSAVARFTEPQVIDVPGVEAPIESAPPAERDSRTPLELEIPAVQDREAHLRGVVLCAATREPLPAFLLSAVSYAVKPRNNLWTTTDAQGRFEFPASVPNGKLSFDLVDDRGIKRANSRYVSVNYDRGGDPIELTATCGPTCYFECEFPLGLGVEDFEVFLTSGRPFQGSAYTSDGIRAALRAPSAAALHPTLPWVRFGILPYWRSVGYVELRSEDGRWRGGAWIEELQGAIREPLKIAFEPACWLVAQVALPPNGDVDYAQFRLIERIPLNSLQRPRVKGGSCRSDGELRIEFLEPGEYRLITHDANWVPFERKITLVPGENDLGPIALIPRPMVGAIRGTIESTSGLYEGACHVSLSNTPFTDEAQFDHSLDFEDDGSGRLVAQIEFENVTAGEWFLYVHCHDGFSHQNSLLTVMAPMEDVRIVLEDSSATLEILLVDAVSGEPISEECRVSWECGAAFDGDDGPQIEIPGMPHPPAGLVFMAEAKGYVPVRGTEANFKRVAADPSAPHRIRATCRMQRGFGGLFQVCDRSSGSPIKGAQIFLDEVLAAESDSKGEYWLELAKHPGRVHVQKPGWLWVASPSIDPKIGQLVDGPEFQINMERR